ncbi:anti-sigma factor [Bacillus sp. FJAT-45037]|uniref:anti-sigma factor n=1 Tax=Bacillus sp. FJAT-45037 TaxID=2011007 RepID=UPI000C2352E8|nr:anti-sigma factor [Bacillus sp. FJAT-45037]
MSDEVKCNSEDTALEKEENTNERVQHSRLRRNKWFTRLKTVFAAFGLLLLFLVVSSVVSAIYHSWGEPERVEVTRQIIDHTLTVSEPYGEYGGTSAQGGFFFNMEFTRDIQKKVGNEVVKVADFKVTSFFSQLRYPERTYYGKQSQNQPAFTYPGYDRGMSDWERLRNLPEGTVVTSYLSFSELLETSDLFANMSGKDVEVSWLAVDTGKEQNDEWYGGIIFDPIGFPNSPIWHEDDFIVDYREETKGFLFGKVISEGASSPTYQEGDVETLHQQFMKTLLFLEAHEKQSERVYSGRQLGLADRIHYLEVEGIKHYGMVVTGPTSEVLALEEEEWIEAMEIDEVELWNW